MLMYLDAEHLSFADDKKGLQTMTDDKRPSYEDPSVVTANMRTGRARICNDGCGLGDGGSQYSEARTYRMYPHLDSTTGSGKGDANEHITLYADCGVGEPTSAWGLK